MSYVLSLRDPYISSSLKGDNVRGESRWERQAAEALLETGQAVHCIQGGDWSSGKPGNFHFGPPSNGTSIAISHDLTDLFYGHHFKACIFNIFSSHLLWMRPELISHYKDRYGKGVIYTHGYYQDQAQIDEISKYIQPEYIEFLGAPSAPKVYESQDNFNCKRIVWHSRGVHLHTFPGRENPELENYVTWLKEKLEADTQLELVIITGLSQADMDWQGWPCTVEQRVFESPIMQRLNHLRNRIFVQTACGWDRILDIMSGAKLCVSLDLSRWGGPPVEAAMYGIPYVSPVGPTAFMSIPDNLTSTGSPHLLGVYDRLLNDHAYYREHGDNIREHVKKHHTYEAFRNRLSEILASRGLR